MPYQHSTKKKRGLALAALLTVSVGATADGLDSSIQIENQTNQESRTSQVRINQLAEQTEDLLSEYRRVVRETESLKVYNDQLEQLVTGQQGEISSINAQLEDLEDTNRGVVPLLLEMIDMLKQIVDNDVPFMLEQRRDIVADLEDAIYRADVTTSEKYRRVMEAYQREIDFGRNVSAYEGTLADTGRTVSFVKVGRVLLIYQTLDGEEQGWWNPASRAWETLDAEYSSSVTRAVRIAQNREAPNLVKLPVNGASAP